MWFRSIYLKTLRDFRVAILGWGLGMGLLMYRGPVFLPLAGGNAAARASLVSLAGTFAWIAEPIAVDTAGGYATFKYRLFDLGDRPLAAHGVQPPAARRGGAWLAGCLALAAAWARACRAGEAGRGVDSPAGDGSADRAVDVCGRQERERGLWSGRRAALRPESRADLRRLRSYCAADLPVHPGACTAAGCDGWLAARLHRAGYGPPGHPQYRLDLRHFSPVYYYNLSKPLVPGYGINAGAMLVLLALCILLSGAAVWLFVRRDVGGTVAATWLAAPARAGCAARAGAAGECLVAALGLYAQPGHDRGSRVLVDAGHRRVCRVDGRRRQANGDAAGQPLRKLTAPERSAH